MDFFKTSSTEDAGADNNCSADGVVGCTTTTDDNLDEVDEVDPLLDTTWYPIKDQPHKPHLNCHQ